MKWPWQGHYLTKVWRHFVLCLQAAWKTWEDFRWKSFKIVDKTHLNNHLPAFKIPTFNCWCCEIIIIIPCFHCLADLGKWPQRATDSDWKKLTPVEIRRLYQDTLNPTFTALRASLFADRTLPDPRLKGNQNNMCLLSERTSSYVLRSWKDYNHGGASQHWIDKRDFEVNYSCGFLNNMWQDISSNLYETRGQTATSHVTSSEGQSTRCIIAVTKSVNTAWVRLPLSVKQTMRGHGSGRDLTPALFRFN